MLGVAVSIDAFTAFFPVSGGEETKGGRLDTARSVGVAAVWQKAPSVGTPSNLSSRLHESFIVDTTVRRFKPFNWHSAGWLIPATSESMTTKVLREMIVYRLCLRSYSIAHLSLSRGGRDSSSRTTDLLRYLNPPSPYSGIQNEPPPHAIRESV